MQASARIPTFRGNVKKGVNTLVATVYGIKLGDAEYGGWLQYGLRFVYPHNYKVHLLCHARYPSELGLLQEDSVDGEKPFDNPVFGQMLHSHFFIRSNSFGHRIMSRFTSTLSEKPNEKEIPAPMLALVTTAVRMTRSLNDHVTLNIIRSSPASRTSNATPSKTSTSPVMHLPAPTPTSWTLLYSFGMSHRISTTPLCITS